MDGRTVDISIQKGFAFSRLFFYAHTKNKSEAYFLKERNKIKDIKEIKDMAE